MSDTDLAQNLEQGEGGEEEEIEVPSIILHPHIDCKVNTQFKCPLKTTSKHTLADAHESARKGCPQCILRTAAITRIFPDALSSAEIQCSHNYIFLPFYIQEQRVVLASEEELHDDEHQLICNFYGDRIGGLGCVEQVVPCNTDSKKSLETVKKWLSECDEGHDCMQFSATEFMPRRLLDIRNNNVRLHETTPLDHGLKYACLSHCWGIPPATMLRTTPATFTAFLQTIPWDTIPPSFQDAISFARKLALPFLWIDALCIIQDDAKDWQQQSSAMADIYQGAYLTLAATSSPNAGGGCYTQMHTSPAHRSTSPLLTIHSANSTRCLSARPKFTHKMSRLPLLTRAWVYQERILSPRVLHFADEELVWECQHAVTCECSGDNLEDRMEHARISLSNSFGLIGPHRRHPAPLDLWFQIVDEYTSLRLKFASDMLPALSGIAKAFAERCGGGYVAGMWRRTLVREMLWYRQEVDGSEIYRGEVRPWRAPSWSWVSRDWPADFRVLPTTREIAQVLDVSCQPAGADPTGQLESATLTLRTKVLRARFEIGSRTIDLFSGDLKIPQAVFQETSYILSELCTGYLDFDEQYQPDILLAQIAECSGDCRMFLAGLPAPVHVTQEVLSFMLLARREEREEGWRRVGLATIAAYEPDSSSFACLTSEERCKIIGDKRKCERPRVSDESAEWKRALFQRLNDSEMQDLLVW